MPSSANFPSVIPVWIAQDPASRALLEHAFKLASSASTVLIQGESGVGKDLLAAVIHYAGSAQRAQALPQDAVIDDALIKIDCASLPQELMESELFGYERGAFTGASQMKRGRLELTAEGTLVLDEVAALTPPMQAKLLRVIEEKRFFRLGSGSTHPLRLQARVIALSNMDLEQAVQRGLFREDLYHRLNVVPLQVPPLRARRADILPLAEHLLLQLTVTRNLSFELTKEAAAALSGYDFPGNVRELRNILERALLTAQAPAIGIEDLPSFFRAQQPSPPKSLEEIEREHIALVLDHCRGKKGKAAEILGISRKNLLEKRKKYGLI